MFLRFCGFSLLFFPVSVKTAKQRSAFFAFDEVNRDQQQENLQRPALKTPNWPDRADNWARKSPSIAVSRAFAFPFDVASLRCLCRSKFSLSSSVIDHSTAFSAFDMKKLGKIRRHHWKERLKIGKLTKVESDSLKRAKIPKSCEYSQTFVWCVSPPYKCL